MDDLKLMFGKLSYSLHRHHDSGKIKLSPVEKTVNLYCYYDKLRVIEPLSEQSSTHCTCL